MSQELEPSEGQTGSTHPSQDVENTPSRAPMGFPAPALEDVADIVERNRVFEALFNVPPEREQLGRYVVLGTLGQGGMGTVLEAFDRTLDRRVALKVLHQDLDARHTKRLLREAQALAKLSHPNVVQVYEAGEAEGRAFIAMELVQGRSLRSWLGQSPRPSWRECVEVYRQAGEGLAAAHARGLIHRDFKPDNAVIDEEGRVRVLDFGLARRAEDEATSPERIPLDVRAEDAALDASLTRTGSVLGTPAYMAPEQLRGQPTDARSDQFSFCVSLFEALYGTRPFPGRPLAALMAIDEGKITEPPNRSSVPRWLRAVVLRGLASEPDERFEDMDALLRELSRMRRRGLWAGLLAGGMLAVGLTAVLASESPPCQIDSTALAGTWDPSHREALRAALAAGGSEADAAERSISRWSDTWLTSLRSACEATQITGTQSEAMLDRRTGCLERQRREATAVIEVLSRPDGTSAGHAPELLGQLPDTSICDDPRLAETSVPLPRDPDRREAILAAYEQLGHARALYRVSRPDEADVLGGRLETETATLGYLPLDLNVRALAAERHLWRQDIDEAVPLLRGVIHDAEIANLDELAATLRTRLAKHVVGWWGRPELQAMVLDEAEISVARLGRPDDRRALELELSRNVWLDDAGNVEAALAGYRASLERAHEREDASLAWQVQRELPGVLVQLGRYDEAVRTLAESRALFRSTWGANAQVDARIELQLGLLELERGRLSAAENHLQTSRALIEPLVEPDATDLSLLDNAEAKLAMMRGDYDRAEQAFARVTETASDIERRAEAWEGLGVIRFYRDDFSGSLEAYRRAQSLYLASVGPEHPQLGILLSNMGESMAAQGDHDGALSMFTAALELLERALPPDHADLALPFKGRAQSRLALGDLPTARIDLERALRLHEDNPGEPLERADVERTLAEVLLTAGEDDRAWQLATVAQQRLENLGHHEAASEITTWIEQHESRRTERTNDHVQ